MGDLLPGLSYGEFLNAALSCRTEEAFLASPFYTKYGTGLERLLLEPRVEPAHAIGDLQARAGKAGEQGGPSSPRHGPCEDHHVFSDHAGPPSRRSLRVVQWNIEKGKALPGLRAAMLDEPLLRDADVYCLNEVDNGMVRSGGNADVALELASVAGSGFAYVPTYIECTRGVGGELGLPGSNTLGLHGLAVLSRLPILAARAAALPSCFDYFGFSEKRYGGRRVLMVLLEWNRAPVLVATTHLEVRNTPACRARQMAAALEAIAAAKREWRAETVVFTGDWNTHTFARGGFAAALRGYLRIAGRNPADLEAELLRPSGHEPLLGLVTSAGLQIDQFNDSSPTAREMLGRVEEWGSLPTPLRALIRRVSPLSGRTLPLRLDWIAAAGATAASPPWTMEVLSEAGERFSDHAAIGVEIRIGQS